MDAKIMKEKIDIMLENNDFKIENFPVFLIDEEENAKDFGKHIFEGIKTADKFPKFVESKLEFFHFQEEYNSYISLQVDIERINNACPFQNAQVGVFLININDDNDDVYDQDKVSEIIKMSNRWKDVVFIFSNYSKKTKKELLRKLNCLCVEYKRKSFDDYLNDNSSFQVNTLVKEQLNDRYCKLSYEEFDRYFKMAYPYIVAGEIELNVIDELLSIELVERSIGFSIL